MFCLSLHGSAPGLPSVLPIPGPLTQGSPPRVSLGTCTSAYAQQGGPRLSRGLLAAMLGRHHLRGISASPAPVAASSSHLPPASCGQGRAGPHSKEGLWFWGPHMIPLSGPPPSGPCPSQDRLWPPCPHPDPIPENIRMPFQNRGCATQWEIVCMFMLSVSLGGLPP